MLHSHVLHDVDWAVWGNLHVVGMNSRENIFLDQVEEILNSLVDTISDVDQLHPSVLRHTLQASITSETWSSHSEQ